MLVISILSNLLQIPTLKHDVGAAHLLASSKKLLTEAIYKRSICATDQQPRATKHQTNSSTCHTIPYTSSTHITHHTPPYTLLHRTSIHPTPDPHIT
eukprot:scaffold13616_cov22-Cyclotella_meneghiniana.AAC.2